MEPKLYEPLVPKAYNTPAYFRFALVSNTLIDHYQNIPARRLLNFRRVGFRASHVALVVALVCGQSGDFRVCRRVTRRVPNRARVRVFCAYHGNQLP